MEWREWIQRQPVVCCLGNSSHLPALVWCWLCHGAGFVTVLALSWGWLCHRAGFVTGLALSLSPGWLCHRAGFVTVLALSTGLALSPGWLCHGAGFVTGLALSRCWLCHGAGFVTGLALSRCLLKHGAGSVTRSISQFPVAGMTLSRTGSVTGLTRSCNMLPTIGLAKLARRSHATGVVYVRDKNLPEERGRRERGSGRRVYLICCLSARIMKALLFFDMPNVPATFAVHLIHGPVNTRLDANPLSLTVCTSLPTSPTHGILTPSQPVLPLTLHRKNA